VTPSAVSRFCFPSHGDERPSSVPQRYNVTITVSYDISCSNCVCDCSLSIFRSSDECRNTHRTRLDKCQGPPVSSGPKPDPIFVLYIFACKWHIRRLRVGFNIVCVILANARMLKRTYIDDPLSGRQRVGRSLKPPSVGVVTVQRSLFTHVACSDAVSCR